MVTLDAHLLALDMKTGAVVWDATLEDYKTGYAATLAPHRRQGQGDRRRRRRRVRHPRLHRRLRRADRQARVALLHHSRARRAGQQQLGRRFVEDRRRRRVGDRRLRSRAEPRSSTAPAIPAPTITARAARATTSTAARSSRSTPTPASSVALPVHAARRSRLGRDRSADPRRPDDRRPAAQDRDVRQSQRLLLHARPHERARSSSPSRS